MRFSAATLVVVATLAAAPAHARFGKSSSSKSSHGASSVGSKSSSGSSSSGSSSAGGSSYGSGYGSSRFGYRPRWYYGFYSGAFVPWYGYGYAYYGAPRTVTTVTPSEEELALRFTFGLEAMPLLFTESGATIGLGGAVEGERWGFSGWAQNIAAGAKDGSTNVDLIQQVMAHLTYAFLTGKYGRLRAEVGFDVAFAADAIFVGPSGGLSGVVWLGGPVAIESSVSLTPVPFQQVDARLGLAIGLGAVGLRAGWRLQVLDDRGAVDGTVNRDVFTGPYAGVSLAL